MADPATPIQIRDTMHVYVCSHNPTDDREAGEIFVFKSHEPARSCSTTYYNTTLMTQQTSELAQSMKREMRECRRASRVSSDITHRSSMTR